MDKRKYVDADRFCYCDKFSVCMHIAALRSRRVLLNRSLLNKIYTSQEVLLLTTANTDDDLREKKNYLCKFQILIIKK